MYYFFICYDETTLICDGRAIVPEFTAEPGILPLQNQNRGAESCARQPAGFLSGWYTTGFT